MNKHTVRCSCAKRVEHYHHNYYANLTMSHCAFLQTPSTMLNHKLAKLGTTVVHNSVKTDTQETCLNFCKGRTPWTTIHFGYTVNKKRLDFISTSSVYSYMLCSYVFTINWTPKWPAKMYKIQGSFPGTVPSTCALPPTSFNQQQINCYTNYSVSSGLFHIHTFE